MMVTLGADATGPVPAIQVDVHAAHGEDANSPKAESPTAETRMLQPGIPMPVSADPTVPDPASVHVSPSESPQSSSPRPAAQHVLSAVPPGLMAKLSRPTSLSGLFTPYSEASSGPSSPAMQDSAPTPEEEVPKDALAAAEGEDDGRREDVEDAVESPDISPLAASVETVYDVDHDADLDADGDIDPDYVEESTGEVPEPLPPSGALAKAETADPAQAPVDSVPTEVAPAEEPEVVNVSDKAEDAKADEVPNVVNAEELPAPEGSALEPPAPPAPQGDTAVESEQSR